MKKYVRIQSTKNRYVVGGLQTLDMSSEVPGHERLNAKSMWTNLTILIKQGAHFYPGIVAEWESVKKLQEKDILTIGQFVDTCPEEAEIEKDYARIMKAYDEIRKSEKNGFKVVGNTVTPYVDAKVTEEEAPKPKRTYKRKPKAEVVEELEVDKELTEIGATNEE